MSKFLMYSILGLFLLASAWVINLIWLRPINIDHFYERVFIELALDNPELLSRLRILEQFGIKFHQRQLADASIDHEKERIEFFKENLATLKEYEREGQTYQQALSYDILTWFLENQVEQEKWQYHNYPVNQIFGLHNNFLYLMQTTHKIDSARDAEDYVIRLSKANAKFSQTMEGLKIREKNGIIPPAYIIEKVLKSMQDFTASPAESNVLYTSLKSKIYNLNEISDDKKREILDDAKTEITQTVYPTYQSYISYFTELLGKSNNEAGVWKFPNGDEFYSFALRSLTTTDLSPAEIHELGLTEVARIQNEMREILAAQEYDTTQTLGYLLRKLAKEKRFLYSDDEAGREKILKDYQAIIDDISLGMDKFFTVKPAVGVTVERMPEFNEKASPAGSYIPPPLDGTRPGVFYANLHDLKAIQKYDMPTLAYHEAIPGHHFQFTIAQNLKGLPFFRRIVPFAAYTEGWALYAERLAWEAGYEKDPFDNLGRLHAELFRSLRLVVDTGLHSKRWTREQAISYLYENTGMTKSKIVAEVERYIVEPGTACAYKMGLLKILDLREKAKTALGDKFDIREFHDVILKNGAMPLSILERIVNDWIGDKLQSQTL